MVVNNKMKNKAIKIFGIVAAVMFVLMAVAPAVTAGSWTNDWELGRKTVERTLMCRVGVGIYTWSLWQITTTVPDGHIGPAMVTVTYEWVYDGGTSL